MIQALKYAIEVGRLMSYRVVAMQTAGLVPNQEASIGKLFMSEVGQRFSRVGLKLFGLSGQLVQVSNHVQPQQSQLWTWRTEDS